MLLALALTSDPAPIHTLTSDARHTYGASVYLCYYAEGRKKLEAALADERKAAKIGGVVNQSETYRLSKNLVDLDKAEAAVRKSMKGAKPLACSADGIRHLVDCLHASDAGRAGDECSDEDWSAFRAAFVD